MTAATARSTSTPARKGTKPRHVRLLAKLPERNAGVLQITEGKDTDRYFFAESRADFGRGFTVEKMEPETFGVAETYQVNLDPEGNTCCCKGFSRFGYCRHVSSLIALFDNGKLS